MWSSQREWTGLHVSEGGRAGGTPFTEEPLSSMTSIAETE